MVTSSIDGRDVAYFCAGEEIASADTEGVRGYEFRSDSAAFDHPHVRRAILDLPMKSGVWRFFGVVHWSDGTDLEALDVRARRGDDIAADLADGLFCEMRLVECLVCHNNHLVAVPDAGNPVATLPRRNAHQFSTTCPTCGNTSYIQHAELFAGG